MRSTDKIEVIQILRGLAATAVVLWHTSGYLGPYGEGLGGALFLSAPTMGVDLFFVISGFIMVYASRGADGSSQDAAIFWVKRFSRVWPVYAVTTLLAYGLALGDPAQTVRRLVESLLFVPSEIRRGSLPTLVVGWTLVYEIYFYTIFSLSLAFGRWRWAVFFAYMALTLAVLPPIVGESTRYLALVTDPILWLFVAGVVIGLIYETRFSFGGKPIAWAAVAAAVAAVVWQYATQFRIISHGLLDAGLTPTLLALAATLASKTIDLRGGSILAYLGERSFSFYLVHPLVMSIYASVALRPEYAPFTGRWTAVAAVCALSVLAARLGYRYLELGLAVRFRRRMLQLLFPPAARPAPGATHS